MELIRAFIIGGLLCAVGQILIDYTKMTPARILVTYIVAGVVISAFGWYQPLVEYAGGGATIPLTGFGDVLAQGVKKAVNEQGAIGILTGGFTAGAAGLTVALVCGLLASVVFKSKDR